MWGRKKFKIGELVQKLALNALFSNFPLIFFGTYLVEKYVINGLPTIYRDYLALLHDVIVPHEDLRILFLPDYRVKQLLLSLCFNV